MEASHHHSSHHHHHHHHHNHPSRPWDECEFEYRGEKVRPAGGLDTYSAASDYPAMAYSSSAPIECQPDGGSDCYEYSMRPMPKTAASGGVSLPLSSILNSSSHSVGHSRSPLHQHPHTAVPPRAASPAAASPTSTATSKGESYASMPPVSRIGRAGDLESHQGHDHPGHDSYRLPAAYLSHSLHSQQSQNSASDLVHYDRSPSAQRRASSSTAGQSGSHSGKAGGTRARAGAGGGGGSGSNGDKHHTLPKSKNGGAVKTTGNRGKRGKSKRALGTSSPASSAVPETPRNITGVGGGEYSIHSGSFDSSDEDSDGDNDDGGDGDGDGGYDGGGDDYEDVGKTESGSGHGERRAPLGRPRNAHRTAPAVQRERNRAAATKCRAKTKAAITKLEEDERFESRRRDSLAAERSGLMNEVLKLRLELLRHSECPSDGGNIQNYLRNAAVMIGNTGGSNHVWGPDGTGRLWQPGQASNSSSSSNRH